MDMLGWQCLDSADHAVFITLSVVNWVEKNPKACASYIIATILCASIRIICISAHMLIMRVTVCGANVTLIDVVRKMDKQN
jgi:hypothetical protein